MLTFLTILFVLCFMAACISGMHLYYENDKDEVAIAFLGISMLAMLVIAYIAGAK